ncbi:MAG TPA: hypothetical protein ENK05_13410 [Gammaproteobacteria bacterium]|nr:hypothetical protein [Gammaproteobacteria bacterium]
MTRRVAFLILYLFAGSLLGLALSGEAFADDHHHGLRIDSAKYEQEKDRFKVKGTADKRAEVSLYDADSDVLLATVSADKEGKWKYEERHPSAIPCRVRARSGDNSDEKAVEHADDFPGGCGLDDGGTPPPGGNPPPDAGLGKQTDFKILMNYELGMHCTGFEFAYCCVLPPYNSILAQVVKPESNGGAFPTLLEGDPNIGKDFVGRETVLRDKELDGNGNFRKYVVKYWHEAQPRNDGRGKPQSSTLISNVELNSLLMWNTTYDVAAVDANNALITGEYNGAYDVVQGDGTIEPIKDSYANGWLNHLYIYSDLEGGNPANSTLEKDKIRLGLPNLNASTPLSLQLPVNSGPAFHPVGPDGNNGPTDNVLTFSGESGTVVFTQARVLENLPVMLTSPRIWEALGLPLTPFEDSIDFYGDPGLVDEDSIRPFVAMKAQLHEANCDASGNCSAGPAVLDRAGNPVIGFGTAPIDIPNCERCHAAVDTPNSPHASVGDPIYPLVQEEENFWNAFYNIDTAAGDSDWYTRLKGAAISMLALHDDQHGTSFTLNYPGCSIAGGDCGNLPQNTRLGHESIICQKCHADNVIAVVKSAYTDASKTELIPPVTEAIHWNHRSQSEGGPIVLSDALGRDGGCQGCHPAHRSNGDMQGYPITKGGENFYANSDNRLASGGCFVGRDVHSNPGRDSDGAETPSHLNAIGQWLVDNVANDSGQDRGIWCTNCHTQLSQELWRAEDCTDLINGDCITNPRAEPTLASVAAAVGVSEAQAISWLDPKDNINGLTPDGIDHTHDIWKSSISDANVATIEVRNGAPWGTTDADGDFSVRILDFCTTPDCVSAAQAKLDAEGNGGTAVPVPFSAATDGRDHWLAPGEPHCADCHQAPYTEQSGNHNPYPPFNYPRKASLMRYSRGHRDITCQGCHESIHGLYPVTPGIDTTTYAQAASLNHDGSHGPLKCGTCHDIDPTTGVPSIVCAPGSESGQCDGGPGLHFKGTPIKNDFDAAVSWAHSFTDEADPLDSLCLNCHEDERNKVSVSEDDWLEHALKKRVTRRIMDQVETSLFGSVFGSTDPLNTVCRGCHDDKRQKVACNEKEWKEHLLEGRVNDGVWEDVSLQLTGSTCGW